MTVRMTTCDVIASQPDLVQHIHDLYWTLEKSNTPISLLIPWLPTKAKKNKKQATTDLYNILEKYLAERREAAVSSANAFDILMIDGDSDQSIIEVS